MAVNAEAAEDHITVNEENRRVGAAVRNAIYGCQRKERREAKERGALSRITPALAGGECGVRNQNAAVTSNAGASEETNVTSTRSAATVAMSTMRAVAYNSTAYMAAIESVVGMRRLFGVTQNHAHTANRATCVVIQKGMVAHVARTGER